MGGRAVVRWAYRGRSESGRRWWLDNGGVGM